jgi:hypothetical protein
VTGGRAYVFDLQGNVEATVLNPTPASQDWFGRTMTAIDDEHFLVGSSFDKTLGLNTGAAYLYNTTAELLQTFLPPEPVPDGHFSVDLATLDQLILIGSHFDGGGFTGPGAVYVYAPIAPLPGDLNGDSHVDQADLDLVLLHWGTDASIPPGGWVSNLPAGLIDQAELDNVLINWGRSRENVGAAESVPEPAGALLAVLVAAACLTGAVRQNEVRVSTPRPTE